MNKRVIQTNEVLKDKTEQGHTLDIYIKEAPHSDTTIQEWVDNKTHLYVVVFHCFYLFLSFFLSLRL